MTLLYVTIPFLALAVTFLILGKLNGGWDALEYLVYAMATGVFWGVAVVGYLAWVVIRDGWQPSSMPAVVVLTAVGLAVAGWTYNRHAEEAACREAQEFYQRLAILPAADRAVAIRDGAAFVRTPTVCAIDGLRMAVGRHVLDPEPGTPEQDATRRAILGELLDAGLPPDYRLLYGFAVSDADPVSTRLLLRSRKARGAAPEETWDLFPDDIVQSLITRARPTPGTPPDAVSERYRQTLAVFLDEARPAPASLTDWTRRTLIELELLPGSPPS